MMTTPKNRVQLTGHLGNDPDVKTTESGKKLVRFSVATNEHYKNHNGDSITETTWHNITAWGKAADMAEQQLRKGTEVYIEGKLQSKSYTDKEGNKRHYTDVNANEIILISKTPPSAAAMVVD